MQLVILLCFIPASLSQDPQIIDVEYFTEYGDSQMDDRPAANVRLIRNPLKLGGNNDRYDNRFQSHEGGLQPAPASKSRILTRNADGVLKASRRASPNSNGPSRERSVPRSKNVVSRMKNDAIFKKANRDRSKVKLKKSVADSVSQTGNLQTSQSQHVKEGLEKLDEGDASYPPAQVLSRHKKSLETASSSAPSTLSMIELFFIVLPIASLSAVFLVVFTHWCTGKPKKKTRKRNLHADHNEIVVSKSEITCPTCGSAQMGQRSVQEDPTFSDLNSPTNTRADEFVSTPLLKSATTHQERKPKQEKGTFKSIPWGISRNGNSGSSFRNTKRHSSPPRDRNPKAAHNIPPKNRKHPKRNLMKFEDEMTESSASRRPSDRSFHRPPDRKNRNIENGSNPQAEVRKHPNHATKRNLMEFEDGMSDSSGCCRPSDRSFPRPTDRNRNTENGVNPQTEIRDLPKINLMEFEDGMTDSSDCRRPSDRMFHRPPDRNREIENRANALLRKLGTTTNPADVGFPGSRHHRPGLNGSNPAGMRHSRPFYLHPKESPPRIPGRDFWPPRDHRKNKHSDREHEDPHIASPHSSRVDENWNSSRVSYSDLSDHQQNYRNDRERYSNLF